MIFQTQLRLLRYGSGKPGDRMVPVRWVRLPPQGTAGKKRREIKKELSNAPNVSWLQTRESKIRYMHTSMHRFA